MKPFIKKHPYLFIAFSALSIIILIVIIAGLVLNLPAPTDFKEQTSKQDLAFSDEYAKNYPVVKGLPIIYANYDQDYNYTEYRIDIANPSDCQKQDFCLIITDVTGGNEQAAKNALIKKGYNPADYEIIYKYQPITPLN